MVDQTALERAEGSSVTIDSWGGRPAQSYWNESWERLRANRFGMAFGYVLVVLSIIAIVSPLVSQFITHYQPSDTDLSNTFAGISHGHLLGTDELGRDTLTRLVWGARVSLGIGFLAVLLYIFIGGTVGMIAGFYGGLIDDILMRFVDVLLAIPTIYLLILVTSLLPLPIGPDAAHHPWFTVKHDAVSISVVIAFTVWGGVARLMRGEVLSIRGRDFMLATRSLGAGDVRLMTRHLLPNALPVLIVTASLGFGQIILLEAALDFIGLGVQPPTTSWGYMLLNSVTYFTHSILLVWLPGLAIVLAVLSANIFGNAIRDAYDPRLK
jgi:peptide/nickel transport system permease protein